jgi:hypothetical protein
MEHFYRSLKQGESKVEALCQAKLGVLRATLDLEAIDMHQPLSSPFTGLPSFSSETGIDLGSETDGHTYDKVDAM